MKKKRRKFSNNNCLKEHKEGFLKYLTDLGYKEICYVKCYRYVLNSLEEYMHKRHKADYTQEVGASFLKYESRPNAHAPKMRETFQLVLRRFDEYMFNSTFVFKLSPSDQTCPEQFVETLNSFIRDRRLRGLKESTIKFNCTAVLKALRILDDAGVKSLGDVKVSDIYETFGKTTDKINFSTSVRRFFAHAYEIGQTNTDLSLFVPGKRKARPVPSVYTKAEIAKFLQSFDTTSNMGKRDYAIVLLSLRLGLRASDILNLKIEDIDFNAKTIILKQRKTETPLRLELLPEVESAVCAYLAESRQDSVLTNVFLTVRSPIRPLSRQLIRDISSGHLKSAGIDIGNRKCGSHSLRMTFASELVSENVPYDAVRKLLGHENADSMKHYVKFDIEGLRPCAIDVPPITGKLSEFVHMGKGGLK